VNGVHLHHVVVGIVFVLGLVSALRLGKPGSIRSRRFYDELKRGRAGRRFEDPDSWLYRLHKRFDDLVGGAPTAMAMLAVSAQRLEEAQQRREERS
jgi:hypothetical protein